MNNSRLYIFRSNWGGEGMSNGKFLILTLCALLILSINLTVGAGQVQLEERILTGYGSSRSEAVINGLIEAIRQVQGLKIEKLEETRSKLKDVMKTENGVKQSKLEKVEKFQQQVTTETDGVIEEYEIIKWEKLEQDEWEVLLRVKVPYYKSRTAGADEKSNLAVMPFRVEASKIRSFNLKRVADRISKGISARAVQSDFFRVIDREYGEEWKEERNLLLEENVASGEMARLGEKLGADYLVVGTLSEVYSDVQKIDYYGLEVVEYQVNLNADIRVIEFATREIVWADMIKVERSGLKKSSSSREKAIINAVIPELIEDLTRKINYGLSDILMPLYIIDLRGEKIYLNQGRGRFTEGERLRVMGAPERIEDPYTDRTRTISGEEKARIKITETKDDYSVAELIEGNNHELRKGLMVERSSTISAEEKTGILLSKFDIEEETAAAMKEVIATPPAEALHISLINAPDFPADIEIISPRGVYSDRVLNKEISIPSYILEGEIREFTLKKVDSISGIFVEKYAMEFTVEVFWRILDKNGNSLIMKEKTETIDFETNNLSGEGSQDYLASVDSEEIEEVWEEILKRIEDDIKETVVDDI
ncbi:MAG: CsgG/HfaB family protein [Patescibacteria group bacterium]